MGYDARLAERVREQLGERPIVEKKMFGGIGFMLQGNMAVGVHGDNLIVRVGPERYEALLSEPPASPFDFTGRPMKGWLFVAPEGIDLDDELERWVDRGVSFALSLPPK